MRTLIARTAFKKDLKRLRKRGLDRGLLDAVIDMLQRDEALPLARRDHALKGEWQGWRDCHIQPDWVLIYKCVGGDELHLARTGPHTDVFND